ncbi:hypothetical protein ACFYXF_42630 [Streptomyces sp. NPDC002680]|uniref:hypothetical protein n=1 Tax=Streptomyces sp. NPDC002680 TaxID=3364659 RepID=UPI00368D465C
MPRPGGYGSLEKADQELPCGLCGVVSICMELMEFFDVKYWEGGTSGVNTA